jgi:hypothetical protein
MAPPTRKTDAIKSAGSSYHQVGCQNVNGSNIREGVSKTNSRRVVRNELGFPEGAENGANAGDASGVREKREKGERVRFVRETNERQESVRREKGVESERRE